MRFSGNKAPPPFTKPGGNGILSSEMQIADQRGGVPVSRDRVYELLAGEPERFRSGEEISRALGDQPGRRVEGGGQPAAGGLWH